MSSQTLLSLVIGLAVLGLLIFRNLTARPVRQPNQRLYLILGLIGILETGRYFSGHRVDEAVAIAALAGSLVLAGAFGALRAMTVRLWRTGGQAWMQGSILTALLWIVAFGAHLGYDALVANHAGGAGMASATVLLYLLVSLAVQRALVVVRATRLGLAAPRTWA